MCPSKEQTSGLFISSLQRYSLLFARCVGRIIRWCSALLSSRWRIKLPVTRNLQTARVVLLISKNTTPSFSLTPWLCPVSDNCWTRRTKRNAYGKPRSLLDSIFIYLRYHSAPTHESGHTSHQTHIAFYYLGLYVLIFPTFFPLIRFFGLFALKQQ